MAMKCLVRVLGYFDVFRQNVVLKAKIPEIVNFQLLIKHD